MRESYRFVVTGRVQGVGFRWATQQQAASLGLDGWVRNRTDGAVEGVAAGESAVLEAFREWLKRGPRMAQVETVLWEKADEAVGAGFVIR